MTEHTNRFESHTTYTRLELETLFGKNANAGLAAKLHREDPQAYQTAKRDAQTLGLLAAPTQTPTVRSGRVFPPNSDASFKPETPQRTYSPRELYLLARFSEQELRDFWNSTDPTFTPGRLAKTDPAKFEEIREASVCRGLVPERQRQSIVPAPPKPADDGRFELSPELCQRANLPAGYRVNTSELETVLKTIADVEQARQQETAERG